MQCDVCLTTTDDTNLNKWYPCKHILCDSCTDHGITTKRECIHCNTLVESITFRVASKKQKIIITDDIPTLKKLVKKKKEDIMITSLSSSSKKKSEPPLDPVLCFLDFETTNNVVTSCIVQFGAILTSMVKDNGQVDEISSFNEYVKPRDRMSTGAVQVTGLTDKFLSTFSDFSTVAKEFFQWLDIHRNGKKVVLIAHNGIGFDFPILVSELYRNNFPPTTLKKHGVYWLFDTLLWARVFIPDHVVFKRGVGEPASYTLGNLHRSFYPGDSFDNAHDALADCRAMVKICCSDWCQRYQITHAITSINNHICYKVDKFIDNIIPKIRSQTKVSMDIVHRKVQHSSNILKGTLSKFLVTTSSQPKRRKTE